MCTVQVVSVCCLAYSVNSGLFYEYTLPYAVLFSLPPSSPSKHLHVAHGLFIAVLILFIYTCNIYEYPFFSL